MLLQRPHTLGALAAELGLAFSGDPEKELRALAPIASAGAGQLSFIVSGKYRADMLKSEASALIIPEDLVDQCPVDYLVSDNPYLSYARASALFDACLKPRAGVHPSAVVMSDKVHSSAVISANCVIEEGVEIGAGTVIGPGTVVGAASRVGENCYLHANVSIYHGVEIGDECIVHSGVVIGGDGFGFSPSVDGWVKIHQIGGVKIGAKVEIGANSCIDRGALADTELGDGVILDDQTMIGHNVIVGAGTAMAGCCQVAGSAIIGRNCTLAGNVGVVGHISIADNVHITARTLVSKSITKVGSYSSGGSMMMDSGLWRKNIVRLSKLDDIYRRLMKLEKASK